MVENQALIIGLEMTLDLEIHYLTVYGDSKLVINQLKTKYEVRKDNLVPYHLYAIQLLKEFEHATIEHVPRSENKQAYALANLAVVLALTDVEDWRQPFIDYLQHGKLPEDSKHRVEIRHRAPRFLYYNENLYKRSFNDVYMRCIHGEEVQSAVDQAHSGVCGAYQSRLKLHNRLKRMGFYWPTMHLFILAATDYFSKWDEVVPLREVKKEDVVNFLWTHIVYRYSVPRYIIIDNGKPFSAALVTQFCDKFGIKKRFSTMYNVVANGLVEAFNKTLCKLLEKIMSKSKKDWHECLDEALWAYRTSYRTATNATPFALVYSVEVVLPLERQMNSLRMLSKRELQKMKMQNYD
ncbi:PREDICTED: uncharacterized protein LOC109115191 [Nelumbo nucifera]|uniref:Uncharacterized protein LOC109115191 n=1 Tax=Nelumbo nucifera TaxID=4432 RepID=A0A1U8Q6N0_NELNU|nr:PREDICTED: uncharacterized protein LOC109115191 [Nelumbo nucifera]